MQHPSNINLKFPRSANGRIVGLGLWSVPGLVPFWTKEAGLIISESTGCFFLPLPLQSCHCATEFTAGSKYAGEECYILTAAGMTYRNLHNLPTLPPGQLPHSPDPLRDLHYCFWLPWFLLRVPQFFLDYGASVPFVSTEPRPSLPEHWMPMMLHSFRELVAWFMVKSATHFQPDLVVTPTWHTHGSFESL